MSNPRSLSWIAATGLLCVLLASTAGVSHADLNDGLVAYWSFDADFTATNGATTFDGQSQNGAAIDTNGRFGGAALFERANQEYVTISAPVITQGQAHSYSAWYKSTVEDITGTDRYLVLETTGTGGADAYSASYCLLDEANSDMGLVATLLASSSPASTSIPDASGTEWHNIIVTYRPDATGNEHIIYLDGNLVTTMQSGDPLMDTIGLIIGGDRTGTANNWDGWIDDVAFWDRLLNAEEIALLQNGPVYRLFNDITQFQLWPVTGGSTAWGDYDNDDDLDILLTGWDGYEWTSHVYRNDGAGVFTDIAAGLPGLSDPSVDWGDYDNDGDLDILLTGGTHVDPYYHRSFIYRNDGGLFTLVNPGLLEVAEGSVAWGDYDNDGDLDVLLTGTTGWLSGNQPVSGVYRNDGNDVFVDIEAGLPGAAHGSVGWGDYDNDGDLDILMTGWTDSFLDLISRIYRNDGSGVFTDIDAGLLGVGDSSADWGDYDNDGDLDILLTGNRNGKIARVYRNDAGAFTDIGVALPGVMYSSVAWGDYDNDGKLDILSTGWSDSEQITRVYHNDGAGVFTDIAAGPLGVSSSSVAWGDYDNDGDLDMLLTGSGQSNGFPISRVYRNDGDQSNSPPVAPPNLSTEQSGTSVTFSWDASSDSQTPTAGLSYNLRIGTTPGGSEIFSSMANATSGYRRVAQLGNAQMLTSWTIDLPVEVIYWSVQAVDGAFAGSPFAAEQSFDVATGVEIPRIPTRFALHANVPNPFNPATTVVFSLPRSVRVVLSIYDPMGRRVRVLVNEPMTAGRHEVPWNGLNDRGAQVASGLYICQLKAGSFIESRRMTLLK